MVMHFIIPCEALRTIIPEQVLHGHEYHAPVAPETQAKIPHKPPMLSPNACSTHATPADGSWNAAPNSAVTNASGMDQMNGTTMNPMISKHIIPSTCYANLESFV